MRVGVVVAQDFWMHFQGIYEMLMKDHQVMVFKQRHWPYQLMSARIDRMILGNDLRRFINLQDITFFEWAEDLFNAATRVNSNKKVIVRLHSHELWDYAPHTRWESVGDVIFVSRAMERKFLERYQNFQGRTHVIHNGVNIERFFPGNREFGGIIGTLGRIDPYKGIYELITVLAEMRKHGTDVTLKLGGSDTEVRYKRYSDEVKLLVERLGMQLYIRFDGQITDTPSWFRGIDIFITNSYSEGLQVSLLEAMASGCYCLSQHWDGAEEVLPAENLYFTQRELVEKIIQYQNLPEEAKQSERRKMREIAVKRFDSQDKVKQVVEIIEKAAGKK